MTSVTPFISQSAFKLSSFKPMISPSTQNDLTYKPIIGLDLNKCEIYPSIRNHMESGKEYISTTPDLNYLIKIDDDYKLVQKVKNINNIEKIIKTYYSNADIEFYEFENNINLIYSQLCESNGFLRNNEIDPKEFIENIQLFSKFTNYMNKININISFKDNFQHTYIYEFDKQLDIEAYDDESNFMPFDNFNDSLLETNEKYNIYFNNQFNNVLLILDKNDYIMNSKKIKNFLQEFELIDSVVLNSDKTQIIQDITNDIFVNIDDAKTKIKHLLNEKIINTKLSIDEIKYLIKKYFTLDSNPHNCIKFSNILTTITNELSIDETYINYIKRQLPVILKDIGLNKKRLADGIYWYGLVLKPIEYSKDNIINNMIEEIALNSKQLAEETNKERNKRDKDLEEIIKGFDLNVGTFFTKVSDIKVQSISNEKINEKTKESIKEETKEEISPELNKIINKTTNKNTKKKNTKTEESTEQKQTEELIETKKTNKTKQTKSTKTKK